MSRSRIAFRTLLMAIAMVTLLPSVPASAATGPPIIGGLAGPLGLSIGDDGTVYVTEAFAGRLTAIDKHGHPTVLAFVPGQELAGVDARGKGTVVFTQTMSDPAGGEESPALDSWIGRVQPNGKTNLLVSLHDYEVKNNPDAANTYGLQNPSPACVNQLAAVGEPATHPGGIDSHPYAVAITPGGYVVADAAANAILRVGSNGAVSTLAVLPPIMQVITQGSVDQLAEQGLDVSACLGATYLGEPVPTDIEIGPDGQYYVSTLPGFPEAAGAGAVWRVNPSNGSATRVTSGLVSPVDLAVAADGTIYVAELFGNRISIIRNGAIVGSRFVDSPGAIEIGRDGTIYVTTRALSGNGAVVTFTP